jgi:hypothetical protein
MLQIGKECGLAQFWGGYELVITCPMRTEHGMRRNLSRRPFTNDLVGNGVEVDYAERSTRVQELPRDDGRIIATRSLRKMRGKAQSQALEVENGRLYFTMS